jgi:catechol 2,3-dioxygenase-like lactoylglutathione lyase family enzyme
MTSFASTVAENEVQPLQRPQPVVRADAMAHVTFERRDTARMHRFLEDFGLVGGEVALNRYYRGYGESPCLVAMSSSPRDRFVGFAMTAPDRTSLERLSAHTSRPIEPNEAPGGGEKVTLIDPDGLEIEFIYGAAKAAPLPTREETIPINTPFAKRRINSGVRTPLAPSPVFRLGHVVLQTPNFDRALDWYTTHFGFIVSDAAVLPDGRANLAFCRLDRRDQATDHHSLAILGGPAASLLHVSFETFDLESVGQGHQYLRSRGWAHHWGIGRHVLGSQIFDYWKDAAGDEWEHYADGDLLDASQPTYYHRLDRAGLWAWGDDLPDSLRPKFSLRQFISMLRAARAGKLDMARMDGLRRSMSIPPRGWMR